MASKAVSEDERHRRAQGQQHRWLFVMQMTFVSAFSVQKVVKLSDRNEYSISQKN